MFRPEDCQIFAFCDRREGAVVERSIDPYEALEAMTESLGGEHPYDVLRQTTRPYAPPEGWPEGEPFTPDRSLIADAREAENRLVRAVHRGFGTEPYRDDARSGLTRTEAIALLVDWLEFLADLKKSTGATPASAP